VVRRFPKARAQRYDRDVTGGKFGHEIILDRFAAGDIDVLVGTQIVAKGLDFPRVTLVGAISADTSINLPDFRAAERTFSLLTQVAGRAGRAGLPGAVVIQTYAPGHFAIQAAALHDYHAFYRDEIRYRQEGLYPPFSQLARLMRSEHVDNKCRQEAYSLADDLSAWIAAHPDLGIDLIGPAPCFINKSQDRFYWQILLRGPDVHPILAHVRRGWAIDVDPMNLL
jgi:primosomal protein N' (replication factor Y)